MRKPVSVRVTERSPDRTSVAGVALIPATLPSPDTQRWVARRKAEVVIAVRAGIITLEEACRRYALSRVEYASWEKALDSHGLPGLSAKRLQEFRHRRPRAKSSSRLER